MMKSITIQNKKTAQMNAPFFMNLKAYYSWLVPLAKWLFLRLYR